MKEKEETVFDFPCEFPIKVMGKASDEFEIEVARIIRKHVPDLGETAIQRRESARSNFAALTITIMASSREQLDAIYLDLTSSEHVIMAL